MFSVYIELRTHRAGEVTWHWSLISMRGLSRLLMFFISFDVMANLACKCISINIVNGLYRAVAEGYQEKWRLVGAIRGRKTWQIASVGVRQLSKQYRDRVNSSILSDIFVLFGLLLSIFICLSYIIDKKVVV